MPSRICSYVGYKKCKRKEIIHNGLYQEIFENRQILLNGLRTKRKVHSRPKWLFKIYDIVSIEEHCKKY